MNPPYPHKEADEEGVIRFELQLLLFIGLFHLDSLRFPGTCTIMLGHDSFVIWL